MARFVGSDELVSALLDDITARGAEVRERVHELLARHKYSGDIKARVFAGYVAIALEHHQAIWQLRDQNLRGAAMALVRTVVDAFLRALWIKKRPRAFERTGLSRSHVPCCLAPTGYWRPLDRTWR